MHTNLPEQGSIQVSLDGQGAVTTKGSMSLCGNITLPWSCSFIHAGRSDFSFSTSDCNILSCIRNAQRFVMVYSAFVIVQIQPFYEMIAIPTKSEKPNSLYTMTRHHQVVGVHQQPVAEMFATNLVEVKPLCIQKRLT